jgi:dTDP-4-dehydrorhamnose reductase
MLHVSTDYVFDGNKEVAYLESDPVCPTYLALAVAKKCQFVTAAERFVQ